MLTKRTKVALYVPGCAATTTSSTRAAKTNGKKLVMMCAIETVAENNDYLLRMPVLYTVQQARDAQMSAFWAGVSVFQTALFSVYSSPDRTEYRQAGDSPSCVDVESFSSWFSVLQTELFSPVKIPVSTLNSNSCQMIIVSIINYSSFQMVTEI